LRILAFSDLHCDLPGAAALVERSPGVDAVVCAGDLASVHEGLEETVAALRPITTPTILVPGNNETEDALRAACEGWDAATVLHGQGCTLDGLEVFGLGGGIPVTPWDWSFDLDEDEAADALAGCPEGALLIVHSPPYGHVDASRGRHLGSRAILAAIESRTPRAAVCGHIHESWRQLSSIGKTGIVNAGPDGVLIEL
jgi:Icc-related predicted phosphoesterase